MDKILKLKRKDGELVNARIKALNLDYIEKIMHLQNVILEGLENKELYADTEREEFEEYIRENGKIIGVLTKDDDLIAMGVFAKKGYDKGNYGYDLDITGEKLLEVGQIESTVVREEFRGNRLQKIICIELEKIAKQQNISTLCATASPYNKFSVNTFLTLGYKIKKDKLKYGGLRRFVLVKEI